MRFEYSGIAISEAATTTGVYPAQLGNCQNGPWKATRPASKKRIALRRVCSAVAG